MIKSGAAYFTLKNGKCHNGVNLKPTRQDIGPRDQYYLLNASDGEEPGLHVLGRHRIDSSSCVNKPPR